MKYAFVAPVKYLQAARRAHVLGSYHLALVQNLLWDAETANVYRALHERGDFIMLDNGEAEGQQGNFEDVLRMAEHIGADEIILPDVIKDMQKTLDLHSKWCHAVPACKTAMIPQGKDVTEYLACLKDMVEWGFHFVTICVPKHLGVAGRVEVLTYLKDAMWDLEWNIHLLGLSANPYAEFKAYRDTGCRVRGIDSAAPVAWAQHDAVFQTGERYSIDWEGYASEKLVLQNLKVIQEEANLG